MRVSHDHDRGDDHKATKDKLRLAAGSLQLPPELAQRLDEYTAHFAETMAPGA